MKIINASILDYSYPGISPDIWLSDGTLNPVHKYFILKLLDSFCVTQNLKNPEQWILDITVIGSLTTNRYTRVSDFDCHVIVDIPKFAEINTPNASEEEVLTYLDNTRKKLDRAKILMPLGVHPLELYFESSLNSSNVENVGRYSIPQGNWLKEPIYFAQDLDYEESRKNAIEEAKTLANELDDSFGEIGRQIQRIDELNEVLQAWPEEKRQLYYAKIQNKLDIIEDEIEKSVAIKQNLVDFRHENHDAFSDNEIQFKFLARFHYFNILSNLKTLMKQTGGQVTPVELPLIDKIISEGSIKEAFLKEAFSKEEPKEFQTDVCVDFDKTIAHEAKFPAIGEPIEGAKEALTKLQDMGYSVIIYSCRADTEEGLDLIREYLDKHDLPYDSIFDGDKPFAKYYIDDHAIRFDNWDNVLKQVEKSEKKASLRVYAKLSQKYWIDPSGKEYPLNGMDHGSWINQNIKDAYDGPDWPEKADAMINDGWTRVTTESDYDFAMEVADINNLPGYLDNFIAHHYTGGGVEIDDLTGEYQDISDPFPNLRKAIYQAKRLRNAASLKTARLADKYWIDPQGKEYALNGRSHGGWLADNAKLIAAYDPMIYGNPSNFQSQTGLLNLADEMIRDGWTRITTESDYDFAVEVNDINNLPSYLDNFVAHHYTGGGVEIDDLEGNYQDISDPFPSLRKAIYQAKRLRNAASLKEAGYDHAYWLDPNGKIFQVRGADATGESIDRGDSTTHGKWILDNMDMLEKDYGIAPNSISGTPASLVELGWTRIGDAYGTDWGVDVSDTDNIPSFVDDAIAQFAPEGSQITIAGPGSSRYQHNQSGYTFEWPVKSIQQTVQQLKNRQSRNPSPRLEVAKQAEEVAINDPNHPDRKGPAYALFNFVQKGLPEYGIPDLEMYDIFGDHPRFGSTVAKKTVEDLGIPIRQGKVAQTKKIKQGEYGALMALVPHNIAQEIVEWGVRNIPDGAVFTSEDNPRLGRELESHITIKYGLLTEDAKHVRRFFNETKPFKAKLGKVRHFEPPEMDFDVVTVEVISDDLNEMNDIVTDEFDCAKGLVSDDYHPHITISYVKRGTGKDFVGAIDFEGTEVELDTVIFSPAKGNRTYFSIGSDKKSSFILEKINKVADFLPSLFNAPDNDWQFEEGGDDKEIALDPDPVSDETTWYAPCTEDKPRTKEVWRQFMSMFSNPFSKKEEMTIDSAYDPEMDEKEKDEMGLDQTQLEYSKGFYDPKKHDFPHNTTWLNTTYQDQEPSKPLPVTYSPQISNEDNLDQNSPGGAPRRFMGRPKGEWSSTDGEIIPALENMLKNREAAIDKMTRDITAGSYSSTYTDEQGEEMYNEQHMNDTDEEPYVNHDQRDYPYGMHDSPENTGMNIGWAKDNQPYVVRLDQLDNPAYRNNPFNMSEYWVTYYNSMPMSDGLEQMNDE